MQGDELNGLPAAVTDDFRIGVTPQQAMGLQFQQALASAEAAEAGLPKGSPDWLRAQDIAMQARAEIERRAKRK